MEYYVLTGCLSPGKKNLAPAALAGLAIKVDFSTVKLRKTNIMDQVFSENSGYSCDNAPPSPIPGLALEYNTSHPVMLLQIKGKYSLMAGQCITHLYMI